jgi:hypothetical protein
MSLLDDASLLVTPNAEKATKLYSIIPTNGNGDFSVTRATTKTRTDSSGLVVNVPINEPSLDYSLGSCPNILLEPQRTNLALRSEEFDNATWVKTRVSVTANSTASPSGAVNADSLIEDTSTATHPMSVGFTALASPYTVTIYAKSNGRNWLNISFLSTANASAYFDLQNGVLGTIGAASTATITSVGNGWYRCSMTATTAAGGNTLAFYLASANNTLSYTGNGTSGLFLWGAQLESGAYATSYIPTTSASVTRNLDVVQATGVSSLIGQTEGTIYWEGTLTSGLDDLFALNRNTTNSLWLYKSSTNTIVFRLYYGGVAASIGGATAYTGTIKLAAAYKSGNSVLYINGVQVGTSATAFAFTGALNDVVLNNTAFLFGNATKSVKTAALFPTRLTNAQLAALTA